MRSSQNSSFRSLLAGIQARLSSWADLAVFPAILILSIPPLVWFGRYWTIYTDSAHYLLEGWKLISGGNVSTGRGPIFTGLIGFLMLFLGRDTESLAWGMRLLALVNPLDPIANSEVHNDDTYGLLKLTLNPKSELVTSVPYPFLTQLAKVELQALG